MFGGSSNSSNLGYLCLGKDEFLSNGHLDDGTFTVHASHNDPRVVNVLDPFLQNKQTCLSSPSVSGSQ